MVDVPSRLQTINSADTIVFDLANGLISQGQIEFPVFFKSDDTIQAVDFAFRFNQPHLIFDTIYTPISTLSDSYYLNPGDSTLRFTSFSIPALINTANLAWVRFSVNALPVTRADFNSVEAYLNGYPCSYKFTDGLTMSIPERMDCPYRFYPNPANNFLVIEGIDSVSQLELMDTQGRTLAVTKQCIGFERCIIDVTELSSGIYFIKEIYPGKTIKTPLLIYH